MMRSLQTAGSSTLLVQGCSRGTAEFHACTDASFSRISQTDAYTNANDWQKLVFGVYCSVHPSSCRERNGMPGCMWTHLQRPAKRRFQRRLGASAYRPQPRVLVIWNDASVHGWGGTPAILHESHRFLVGLPERRQRVWESDCFPCFNFRFGRANAATGACATDGTAPEIPAGTVFALYGMRARMMREHGLSYRPKDRRAGVRAGLVARDGNAQ